MNTLATVKTATTNSGWGRGQHKLTSIFRPTGLLLIFYGVHSFVGLTYEVVWIKYLTSMLGMTLPAFSIVLGTFMAGLGIGSFVLSSFITHTNATYLKNQKSSFIFFAFLQTVIGLLGMAFPYLLEAVDSLYIVLAPETENVHHLLIRGLCAGILLLPITSLLGTGFPLLAGFVTTLASQDSPQRPGLVYYVGVVTSALGALASLVMIPAWGLRSTSFFLGFLNLVIAVGAYLLSISDTHNTGVATTPTSVGSTLHQQIKPHTLKTRGQIKHDGIRLIFGMGALTGFLLLSLEIIGAQYLWLVINATAYSEGLLLAVILLAMGLGATLYLVLRSHVSPVTLLWLGFFGAVFSQMALIPLADTIASLFDQFLHQAEWVQEWIGKSTLRFFMANGALTFSVMSIPSMGYGLAFCCLCEMASRHTIKRDPSRSTLTAQQSSQTVVSPLARLYAWHNWGSVAGVFLTSFVLIPWLGLTISLTVLSVLGLTVLWAAFIWPPFALSPPSHSSPQRSSFHIHPAPVGLVLVIVFLWIGTQGDLTFEARAAGSSQDILFQREDASGVVEVFAERHTGERTLLTSRLRQEGANGTEDLRVQRLQGYLPILLHPSPTRTLVIGLGTGIAAGPYLRDEVEEVTIVEISEGIIQAASLFAQDSYGILSHPKTRIVKQDGRNFIKLSHQQYDLIVQELFFPYQSGVGSLYTLEHYQRCRERLVPGGMLGQWITINQLGLEELRVLIHTFQTVFPHTSLWLHGGYLLLFGGVEPLSIDFSTFSRRFYENDSLGGIASLGTDLYDVLSRFVTQGTPLRDWVSGESLNTDDNRLIEYSVPLSFAKLNTTTLAAETLESFQPLLRPLTNVVSVQQASSDASKLNQVSEASAFLLQGIVARTKGQHVLAESLYARAWQNNPHSHQAKAFLEPLWSARGRTLLLKGEQEEASRWLNKAFQVNDSNPNILFDLGLLASQEGNDRKALTLYKKILNEFPNWPQRLTVTFNLGLSHYRMENYVQAAQSFQKVTRAEPSSVNAHFNLANSLAQTGDYEQAAIHYRTVLQLAPDHQQAQDNYGEIKKWLDSQTIGESWVTKSVKKR